MKVVNLEVCQERPRSSEQSSTLRYLVPLNLEDLNNPHTLAVLSTPPRSRVLDVGCGPGVVAAALARRQCTVWGVEIDPEAAGMARPHCEDVLVSDVERLDFSTAFRSQLFDVVLLLDVLEHVREPTELLRQIGPLVRDGGTVMASIPNIAHGAVRLALLSGHFRYSETGLLDRTHIRFFDGDAVSQLFDEAGYSIQSRLRVVRDLDQTEIPVDLGSYPETLVSELRQDPLALTYQFFVIASPQRPSPGKAQESDSELMLAERYQARIGELETLVRQGASYARHVEEALRKAESNARAELEFLEREAQIKEEYLVEMRAELERMRAEIEPLRSGEAGRTTVLEEARNLVERSRLTETFLHHEVARRQDLIEAMAATRMWRLRTAARRVFRFGGRMSGSAAESQASSLVDDATAAYERLRIDREAKAWFESHSAFFFIGLGRSGTMLLSKLLDQAPGAAVFHEPIPEDAAAFVEAQNSQTAALRYVETFRKARMYELTTGRGATVYGEANSYLRFHAQALRACFPSAKILHLVRDGRDVVRSLMSMGHYTDAALEKHYHLEPAPDDPLRSAWNDLSRFEKICWLWSDANRRLRDGIDGIVRFEDLVGDYEYFRDHVETALGLGIGEALWRRTVQTPVNASARFDLAHWTEWEDRLRGAFERICGEEMRRLGYS